MGNLDDDLEDEDAANKYFGQYVEEDKKVIFSHLRFFDGGEPFEEDEEQADGVEDEDGEHEEDEEDGVGLQLLSIGFHLKYIILSK